MRLIDADTLRVHHGVKVGDELGGLRAIVFKRDIDNAPTIDAAPVVRCKDCKYYKPWEGTILSYCSYHDNAQYVRRAEDYCSRGERKDDG